MRRGDDFRRVIRSGCTARRAAVVAHVLLAAEPTAQRDPLVGLVVGRSVGGAVRRNRTRRQLRAALRPLVADLAPGSAVVVRALPQPPGSSSPAGDAVQAVRAALGKATLRRDRAAG